MFSHLFSLSRLVTCNVVVTVVVVVDVLASAIPSLAARGSFKQLSVEDETIGAAGVVFLAPVLADGANNNPASGCKGFVGVKSKEDDEGLEVESP